MSQDPVSHAPTIGEARLGALAKRQIDAARRDPRLSRGREAMVANYWDAVEEAERYRRLTIWGLRELSRSLEREERRLGVRRDALGLTRQQEASLQAAWGRAELARGEIENEYPFANAMTLVALQGALDALVEELVPSWATVLRLERALSALDGEPKAVWDALPADVQQGFRLSLLEKLVAGFSRSRAKPSGGGTKRYEEVLKHAGLAAPRDRPIPADLDVALTELTTLRNVVVHRGGRVDESALRAASTLRYRDGDLVRISRADYREYSAAIIAYGAEVVRRLMRDLVEEVDLAGWRGYVELNA